MLTANVRLVRLSIWQFSWGNKRWQERMKEKNDIFGPALLYCLHKEYSSNTSVPFERCRYVEANYLYRCCRQKSNIFIVSFYLLNLNSLFFSGYSTQEKCKMWLLFCKFSSDENPGEKSEHVKMLFLAKEHETKLNKRQQQWDKQTKCDNINMHLKEILPGGSSW